MFDGCVSWIEIPERYRRRSDKSRGFPPERWARFRAALDQLCGLVEVRPQIDPAKGYQLRHDPERCWVDLDQRSWALDRIEANSWVFVTDDLTPLMGCIQLIARLKLPGVRLCSSIAWDGSDWIRARALYAKAFGVILQKSPLAIGC